MITAERYHDISMGHRVVGHENKCRHLHGHNYRIHFVCEASSLDALGRVIDFGEINDRLCEWLEEHWDHRTISFTSSGHSSSRGQASASSGVGWMRPASAQLLAP